MMELVSWYLESVSAFFVILVGGGLFKLILILLLLRCIFGRRRGWGRYGHCHHCRCSHCGCRCGHCPCGAGKDKDSGDGGDDDVLDADVVIE